MYPNQYRPGEQSGLPQTQQPNINVGYPPPPPPNYQQTQPNYVLQQYGPQTFYPQPVPQPQAKKNTWVIVGIAVATTVLLVCLALIILVLTGAIGKSSDKATVTSVATVTVAATSGTATTAPGTTAATTTPAVSTTTPAVNNGTKTSPNGVPIFSSSTKLELSSADLNTLTGQFDRSFKATSNGVGYKNLNFELYVIKNTDKDAAISFYSDELKKAGWSPLNNGSSTGAVTSNLFLKNTSFLGISTTPGATASASGMTSIAGKVTADDTLVLVAIGDYDFSGVTPSTTK